jgi:outer membrane protein
MKMTLRPKLLAALIASILSAPSLADDLMSAYRDALAADPVYSAARASYEASKEKVVQGRALLLPNANLTAGANYTWLDVEFGGPGFRSGQRDFTTLNGGVNITQPLYRRQNNVTYEQAGIQVSQAQTQLAQAGQDLVFRVAQAYFDVLLAQFDLTTVEGQKAATAEQLAQAKRNFEVGTATITDTYDAQARYDIIVAREIATRNDIEVKKRALQQIIGKAPGPLQSLGGGVALSPPTPNEMEQWVEAGYANSQQVKIAKDALELARKEVQKATYGHHPTLDAVGSANYTDAGSSTFGVGQKLTQAVVGVQLALPLYSGGSLSSKVREAIANQTKSEQDLENSRRTVAQAVRQSFLAVTTGLSEIKALEQAVASNQLSVEASKLGQEVGVRTQVDVLNALSLLYEAQRNLARSYYVTILSQLKLKQSVGRLTEADLENVNKLLVGPPR